MPDRGRGLLNRAELLKSVKDDHRILLSRVLDKAELARKSYQTQYTDFLDMYQQAEISKILTKAGVNFELDGGYEQSERKIAVIFGQEVTDYKEAFPVKTIKIEYNSKFGEITHRDVLGSIMSLGIKREKIGDIIVGQGVCSVFVLDEISHFIIYNLGKVRKLKVTVGLTDIDEVITPDIQYKEIVASIPSMRLDCVVEAGFNISRTKAAQLITGENVFVNWEMINKSSFSVKEGDTITVRRMGRAIFDGLKGKSRKDRNIVIIRRII